MIFVKKDILNPGEEIKPEKTCVNLLKR